MGGVTDRANGHVKVDRVSRSLDDYLGAKLPVMLLRQCPIHRSSGSIAFEGFQLIWRNAIFLDHVEDFIGIDAELSKSVLWFCVLINAPKPVPLAHAHYTGNCADFFAIIRRQPEDKRH